MAAVCLRMTTLAANHDLPCLYSRHTDPHIGLLHRGTEKLIEYKTYLQARRELCGITGGAMSETFHAGGWEGVGTGKITTSACIYRV